MKLDIDSLFIIKVGVSAFPHSRLERKDCYYNFFYPVLDKTN